MKLRTTRSFITLIALLVAGIATTNAQTYNVQGWTPYGSLTLQNLTTKSGSSNKQIEITNSAIQVKDGSNAKTEITNAGLLIQKGSLSRIDIRDHEIKVTTNRDATPVRHGKISVEYLCDENGLNCRKVSQITTGTMPTVPTITIPTTYWKLNSAGTILQTSGGNYGIEINGQGKGISVSDGNVDIQQGSLNTWMINDNQNHGLTIKSQTTINGDLNVSGQNAGITVNDGDIEVVHGHVNVAIGNLTMSNGNLTMSNGNLTMSNGNLTMSNGDININGQGKGISVSNGNVDIQQGGSLNTWKINDNQNHNLTIKSPTNITSGLTIEGKTLAKSGLTIEGKTLAKDGIEIYRTRGNYRPKILDITDGVPNVGIYDNVVIENQNTASTQQYFSIIQLRPNTTTTNGSNIHECGSNPTNALNSIISCDGSTEGSIIYYRQRGCFTADDRYVGSFAGCVCDANFSNQPITQFCKWKTIIQN